jgi:hypothetical protein
MGGHKVPDSGWMVGTPQGYHDVWRNIAITVRREKALVHSGIRDPPGNWIAPPGSNRSGGGDNKTVGASGVKDRIRRLGESAGCNTSER